jgi:outer membrane protein TolC
MTDDTDLRNIKGRLQQLGVSAAISAVFTFVTVTAMLGSGRGTGSDPMNTSTAIVLAIAIFVIGTLTANNAIAKAKQRTAKLSKLRR